ncbi:Murein L,D-transpeptidase YafK [Filomicrobium insigne]|uniref:Murein L,D-transpeptidase YafK n=1 Tax=Filomicrobium insigne TaxID=418854 RepID=A0A1H0TNL5_9HYPH|nr:murein L,D-transpeptidase family protein [Filomicrobium insigne]SDP55599.1 Murein L,D-transpeptidase YafK [Filomicrobium insigne]
MTRKSENREPRRRRRPGAALFVLGTILILLGAVFVRQHWTTLSAYHDDVVLQGERLWRKAFARFGLPLPRTPDLNSLEARLQDAGLKLGDPIFMRIFKREFLLEIWIQRDGKFQRFATYPICRYSGQLGPKLKQGDHQSPEGIYTVSSGQLNPASRWHRSFNLGFPNAFDRSHDRTGTFLMVHGGCSSIGCYAMTNDVIDEIWEIVTSALKSGQPRFQVQIFPFRMTSEAIEARADHKWAPFWRDLKHAHDLFEKTQIPPRVAICRKRYVATPGVERSDGSATIGESCATQNAVVTN